MTTKSIIKHVTPATGNVFLDLGFPQEEAAALMDDSNRIIAGRLAVKEFLMTELSQWIDKENLTEADAAQILGVTRLRVSDIVNKKFIKFSVDSLIDMLARTGRHVHVSVT